MGRFSYPMGLAVEWERWRWVSLGNLEALVLITMNRQETNP